MWQGQVRDSRDSRWDAIGGAGRGIGLPARNAGIITGQTGYQADGYQDSRAGAQEHVRDPVEGHAAGNHRAALPMVARLPLQGECAGPSWPP